MIFRKKKETDIYKTVNQALKDKLSSLPDEHPIFNFNISVEGDICKGSVALFQGVLYIYQEGKDKLLTWKTLEPTVLFI